MPSTVHTKPASDALLSLLNGNAAAKPAQISRPLEPTEPEMLTKPQAAALLNVSVRTMDRLVSRGEIPQNSYDPARLHVDS